MSVYYANINRSENSLTLDSVVFTLWADKKISAETALANISNRVLRAKIA